MPIARYVFKKRRYRAAAAIFDAFGSAATVMRRQKVLPEPHAILIVRLDHLGDVLLATGIPKILKENFPGARVLFLTSRAAAPLLEGNPFVDEILAFDARWFARRGAREGGSALELVRLLRSKRIDLALSMRGDARENAFLSFAGIPHRIGYGITGGGFFLTRELPYETGVHESRHSLDILRALGIHASSIDPQIYFSQEEEGLSAGLLSRFEIRPEEKIIGFQREAGSDAKEWSAERSLQFVRSCLDRLPDHRMLLFGLSPEKNSWAGPLIADKRVISSVGQTTLRESLSLLRRCRFYVGPDTGLTHMAAWLGVPTLFIFSGTNRPEEWKCLAESAHLLKKDVECSPCGLRRCPVPGHPCMEGIEAAAAVRVLEERLSARGKDR